MLTRILFLVAIIGLIVLYFGISRSDTVLMLGGLVVIIVGLVGANYSARNKKGMGFMGWIWKRL